VIEDSRLPGPPCVVWYTLVIVDSHHIGLSVRKHLKQVIQECTFGTSKPSML